MSASTALTALISVSDKSGIVEFAQALAANGVRLLSTGGTARLLAEKDNPRADVIWGLGASSIALFESLGMLQGYTPKDVDKIKPVFRSDKTPTMWTGMDAWLAVMCFNTIEGGTHVAGFRRAITRVFQQYGKKEGMFEKSKVEVEGDDFREGLSAVISVKVPERQFEGQTKTKLGNSEVIGIVDTTVARALQAYLEENPKEAKSIISKVILAAQARAAASVAPLVKMMSAPSAPRAWAGST